MCLFIQSSLDVKSSLTFRDLKTVDCPFTDTIKTSKTSCRHLYQFVIVHGQTVDFSVFRLLLLLTCQ
jgi:hypothetical protein